MLKINVTIYAYLGYIGFEIHIVPKQNKNTN